MGKMKAIVYEKFGPPDVLELREVKKPVPGDNEVLIKVHTTTVNAADCNARDFSFIPPGLGFLVRLMLAFRKPRINILGSALAGVTEAVGKDVELFKAGDAVFGTGPESGTYADYACRSEAGALAINPINMSFEQSATVPYGALTALYFLRDKGKIKSGQKVLINGASGGVGVFALQLAHYFGAEVTGGLNDLMQMLWTSVKGGRKVIFGGGAACERKENLTFLKELIEMEKLKAVIDRSYPLEEIVEAHRYVENGHKKGSIVIIV